MYKALIDFCRELSNLPAEKRESVKSFLEGMVAGFSLKNGE